MCIKWVKNSKGLEAQGWGQQEMHCKYKKKGQTICLGDIRNLLIRSKFAFFSRFSQFLVQCTKMSFQRGGGGGMWKLFEIREKRAFQKCMGWGGSHF